MIAVAAFVVYAPSSFGYLVWGLLLDNFPGDTGYRYLFTTLAVIGVSGAVAAIFLVGAWARDSESALRERSLYWTKN